jgi:hypothetical protein
VFGVTSRTRFPSQRARTDQRDRSQLQRVKRELLHRETKTDASTATLPLPDICVAALAFQRTRQDEARIPEVPLGRASSCS